MLYQVRSFVLQTSVLNTHHINSPHSQLSLGGPRPVNTITLLPGSVRTIHDVEIINYAQPIVSSSTPPTTLCVSFKQRKIYRARQGYPMLILIGTISNSNQSNLIHCFIYLSISLPIRWSNGRDLDIFIFCLCGGGGLVCDVKWSLY